jgi:phosphotransferase system enzyme I (PtsP)
VCGELAGDPAAAIVLLGLGVDSLSMSVGSLLRVKSVLRTCTQTRARELTQQVLQMEKEVVIRALLNNALEGMGLGGLVRAGR